MEKEKKELEVTQEKEVARTEVQVSAGASPAEVAVNLLAKGVKPEDLEKMLTLQERYESEQARKAYYAAMARVQRDIPVIGKRLDNAQTHSKYAALDAIVFETKKIYTAAGFSVSFYEGETDKPEHIRIMADIKHNQGHMETVHYDMPLDGKGIKGNVNMTPIHAKGSSMSYGRRYLMCMIWNIPTGDDDDGNGATAEYITQDQILDIEALLSETKADKPKFLAWMKVEGLEGIQTKDYNRAIEVLVARQKKQAQNVDVVDVEKEGK